MSQSRLLAPLRVLIAVVFGLAILASPAQAALITLNFAGNVDLSSHGGAASNPFSGFFTFDSTKAPFAIPRANEADYDVVAYQMIFNGIDYTRPIIGNGTGNGIAVFNDASEDGLTFDAIAFFASLDNASPSGNDLLFLGAFGDPTATVFNSTALPTNTDFLAKMTFTVSEWTDEIPGGGEGNDIPLGLGSFTITGARVVPEPATLALTAFGLAGALARRRRARR